MCVDIFKFPSQFSCVVASFLTSLINAWLIGALSETVSGSGSNMVKSAAFVGISPWTKLEFKADLYLSSAITVTDLIFL